MTETAQGLAPAVGEEPKGKPTPTISPASPAENSATTSPDTDAIVAKLMERLTAELDPVVEAKVLARVNSMKDKRLAKVDEILEFVKAAGGDPNKVQGTLTIRTLEERLEALEQPASPAISGKVAGGDDEARTAKFLNDLKDESGVELSDEELARIWGGKRYTNWDDAFKDAKKAAWKKAKGESIGAGAVVTEAGATASADDVEDLARELNQLQKGNISDPNNKKRRAEIKAKLAAQRG
jgi:hypothetical protein